MDGRSGRRSRPHVPPPWTSAPTSLSALRAAHNAPPISRADIQSPPLRQSSPGLRAASRGIVLHSTHPPRRRSAMTNVVRMCPITGSRTCEAAGDRCRRRRIRLHHHAQQHGSRPLAGRRGRRRRAAHRGCGFAAEATRRTAGSRPPPCASASSARALDGPLVPPVRAARPARQPRARSYALTTVHAVVGLVGVVLGVFLVIRGNQLMARGASLAGYRTAMRAAYVLYMLGDVLGVVLYVARR